MRVTRKIVVPKDITKRELRDELGYDDYDNSPCSFSVSPAGALTITVSRELPRNTGAKGE